MAYLKTTYSRPRWAKFETFVRDLAFRLNLEIEFHSEKGWIFESGRFKLTGSDENISRANKIIKKSIEEYNG